MLTPRLFDPTGKADVQIFEGWATVDLLQWRRWIKPRGKTQCQIFVLGAGGGAGGGFTAAAAAARGGGGGGGTGAQASWQGPLYALPNVMSVQAGAGGTGGAAGAAGLAGVPSRISLAPKTAAGPAANFLLSIGGGSAGGGGTGAAAGAGGIAGTLPSVATSVLSGLGLTQFLAGQAGAAGGVQTGAVGVNATIPVTGLRCMGGSGGGGVTAADFAGGGVTAITDAYFSETRPIACAAGSNPGSGGFFQLNPFWSWPGMGGGASNAGVGGVGGPGAFGSGGGGGGGGTTGGRGGDGGPGLVVIICW